MQSKGDQNTEGRVKYVLVELKKYKKRKFEKLILFFNERSKGEIRNGKTPKKEHEIYK